MLKENKRIIDFWNQAAKRNARHETVSQWQGESDEQYARRWIEEGAYLAAKILAVSPANPVALEIGPGLGRITVPMLPHCQSILGLDIAPKMVRATKKALADKHTFSAQLIRDEDLRFLPRSHFDLAYSIGCFQHAEKKTFFRYLRGIRRALQPTGVLFFGVMNLCSERGWKHFEGIVETDYPEFFHTAEEVTCYLTHAGYSRHELSVEGETLWAVAHP